MIALIYNEFVKTFSKMRTYLGFMAIGFFLPLVFVAMKLGGAEEAAAAMPGLAQFREFFLITGNLFNCFQVTRFMMMTFFVHIPFLIALVGGDMIAGEATAGTLRILLTRPPSRQKIVLAKIVVTIAYTGLLILFMLTLALGLGYLLFGAGELLLADGSGLAVIPVFEALWRTVLAFALAFLAMGVIAGLSFLFSVLVENAIGPIIGAMVVVILFLVITEAPFKLFEAIRPYLFTTYSSVWRDLYLVEIPWDRVLAHAGYLTLYAAGFFAAAALIFVRKDILS